MVKRVSRWSTQNTQDFVVFWPLMSPSTTNSRRSALVLSQFFSPDLILTFSTSIGMVAPDRTCNILSRSVSFDLFSRLICFLALWGRGVVLPTSHSRYPTLREQRRLVTCRIFDKLHCPSPGHPPATAGYTCHYRDNRGILETGLGMIRMILV